VCLIECIRCQESAADANALVTNPNRSADQEVTPEPFVIIDDDTNMGSTS